MIWIPRAWKNGANQPPGPNSTTAARPTVTGDSAKGMSTTAFMSARPQNRCRTSTHATMTPNAPVTSTVITVIRAVSWNAWITSGCPNVSTTFWRPARATVTMIAIIGSSRSSSTQPTASARSPRRPHRVRPVSRVATVALMSPPPAASATCW